MAYKIQIQCILPQNTEHVISGFGTREPIDLPRQEVNESINKMTDLLQDGAVESLTLYHDDGRAIVLSKQFMAAYTPIWALDVVEC